MDGETMRHLTALMGAAVLVAADPDYETPLAAKDFDKALAVLEEALKADPNSMKYGSEYRMAVIQAKQHDRCIKFLETLAAANPKSANLHLNHGFAYVDKIPVAGSITQVLLANTALGHFGKSIEIQPMWIALYTRGNAYLFWPKIFKRMPLAIADLEQAMKMQKAGPKRPYHIRNYIALGDGYFKNDEPDKAKATWQDGLREFPNNDQLKLRLAKNADEMAALINDVYDPTKRVDTNLSELWKQP
jgi:tetratricopeptide (TPR) repeat protein